MVTAPPEFKPKPHATSAVYPPIQKLGDDLVVDHWRGVDGELKLKLWKRADNPNIALLPTNAPRAVRGLYTAEGQLRLLRNDFTHVATAWTAWETFLTNASRPRLPRG